MSALEATCPNRIHSLGHAASVLDHLARCIPSNAPVYSAASQ